MVKYDDLVNRFADGKIQQGMVSFSRTMKYFIDRESPIIAEVSVKTKNFWTKALSDVDKNHAEIFFRDDAESAKKDLQVYNLVNNILHNQLAIVSSNFNLLSFLKANGINFPEVYEFQEELKREWDITYAHVFEQMKEISTNMELLGQILNKEVILIDKIPRDVMLESLDELQKLRDLFEKEKKLFWKIASEIEFPKNILEDAHAYFKMKLKKAQKEALALYKIKKSGFKQDYSQAETRVKKLIIIATFALGFYATIKRMKDTFGVGFIVQKLGSRRKDKYAQKVTSASANTLDTLAPEALAAFANL